METIEDYKNSMTIYYRKTNGEIKHIIAGIQDMYLFGDEKEDYELIWNFTVLPRDEYVIKNKDKFIINSETKELMIKSSEVLDYPIAPIPQ